MNCAYCGVTKSYPDNFPIPGHAECIACIEGIVMARIKDTKERQRLKEPQNER